MNIFYTHTLNGTSAHISARTHVHANIFSKSFGINLDEATSSHCSFVHHHRPAPHAVLWRSRSVRACAFHDSVSASYRTPAQLCVHMRDTPPPLSRAAPGADPLSAAASLSPTAAATLPAQRRVHAASVPTSGRPVWSFAIQGQWTCVT